LDWRTDDIRLGAAAIPTTSSSRSSTRTPLSARIWEGWIGLGMWRAFCVLRR